MFMRSRNSSAGSAAGPRSCLALSARARATPSRAHQSGDVDFLVATDAIGMGLNLDVDHIAFAGSRKFDGRVHRDLTPAELAQIAGRAGRHLNDGTFGVTADVEPFDQELVNKLENHDFSPSKSFNGAARSSTLTASTASRTAFAKCQIMLVLSGLETPTILKRWSLPAAILASRPSPQALPRSKGSGKLQVPDYRKVAPNSHAEIVATLYKHIMSEEGLIPEDWFASQVEQADRTDGDIDTLSNRIAHIRTWTFVSNRREWLKDPDHWQAKTREIEDRSRMRCMSS